MCRRAVKSLKSRFESTVSISITMRMSLKLTPTAKEKAFLNPWCILFCINEKNAGPRLNSRDSSTPQMIPIRISIPQRIETAKIRKFFETAELFLLWTKKEVPHGTSFFSFKSHLRLFLGAFFDGEFTSVVAALGAYMVVHDLCAAIAAGSQLGALQRIVRSSLGRSGLRESVFWMWHIITFLII